MPTIWQARWWSILLTPIVNVMMRSNELIQMLITECFIFFGTFINLKIKNVPYTYFVKMILFFLILISIMTRQFFLHSLSHATCLILISERNNKVSYSDPMTHPVGVLLIYLVYQFLTSIMRIIFKQWGSFWLKIYTFEKVVKSQNGRQFTFISHKFLC
jgi:hypothetical protein